MNCCTTRLRIINVSESERDGSAAVSGLRTSAASQLVSSMGLFAADCAMRQIQPITSVHNHLLDTIISSPHRVRSTNRLTVGLVAGQSITWATWRAPSPVLYGTGWQHLNWTQTKSSFDELLPLRNNHSRHGKASFPRRHPGQSVPSSTITLRLSLADTIPHTFGVILKADVIILRITPDFRSFRTTFRL